MLNLTSLKIKKKNHTALCSVWWLAFSQCQHMHWAKHSAREEDWLLLHDHPTNHYFGDCKNLYYPLFFILTIPTLQYSKYKKYTVHNWIVKILGLIYAFVLTKLWQSISASNKTCNERLHWKSFMVKFWHSKLYSKALRCTFFGELKSSCSSKSCIIRSVVCNTVFKNKKSVLLKVSTL